MRISDWSSDVCPSDLFGAVGVALFGDYGRAKLKGDLGNLPRIPAGRLGARADGQWGPLSGDVEYYHIFEQDRIAAFETRTAGYDMLNATLAYKLELGPKADAELFVRATNLTNELAYNHASRSEERRVGKEGVRKGRARWWR